MGLKSVDFFLENMLKIAKWDDKMRDLSAWVRGDSEEERTFTLRFFTFITHRDFRLKTRELVTELQNRSFPQELDITEIQENVCANNLVWIIPEPFRNRIINNERIRLEMTFENFHDYSTLFPFLNGNQVLFQQILIDHIDNYPYRDYLTTILRTIKPTALYFSTQNNHNIVYVAFFGKRAIINDITNSISNAFQSWPFVHLCETYFTEDDIETIRAQLNGTLYDTLIEDYEDPHIHSIRIHGRQYENSPKYQSEKELGTIRTHQMAIKFLGYDGDTRYTKIMSISRDGLIRFYSKISLSLLVFLIQTVFLSRLKIERNCSNSQLTLPLFTNQPLPPFLEKI